MNDARARLPSLLPIVVAVFVVAAVAGTSLPFSLFLLVAFVAVVGPRIELGLVSEVLVTAVLLILGFTLSSTFYAPHVNKLALLSTHVAVAALSVAVVRRALAKPLGGALGTVAWELVALGAVGERHAPRWFVLALGLYLIVAFGARRFGDASRPPLRALTRRALLAGAAFLLLTVAVAYALVLPLHPLQRWSQQRFDAAYLAAHTNTGFSDRMRLDSMERMEESDEVVLRLTGPATDYLRGVVYDSYEHERWSLSRAEPTPATFSRIPKEDAATVHVRRVAGPSERLFFPYDAAQGYADGALLQDRTGIVFALKEGTTKRYAFRPRSGPRPVDPPGDTDLHVPKELAPTLTRLAREWTEGASDPMQKLLRIEEHLAAYRYVRGVVRPHRAEPIVDFLFVHREGHCEYFASALVLLARAAGLPARVVGGYRVDERSPLGYWLVRERNAHSWAEVYVPGQGWLTRDATPAEALAEVRARRSSQWRTLLDALGYSWEAFIHFLEERTVGELFIGGFAMLGFLGLVQFARTWRPGRGRAAVADPRFLPLPSFVRLERALDGAGLSRERDEPLERFAARVSGDVGALVLEYAALRYGGEGDEAALARALDACAERLQRTSAASRTQRMGRGT